MTSEEARKDGWSQVTHRMGRDECVATTNGEVKAWLWCTNEVIRIRDLGRVAAVAWDSVENREFVSVWAYPAPRITATAKSSRDIMGGEGDGAARVERAFRSGLERATRSHEDYWNEELAAILYVEPLQPCSCIRCRVLVSAERLEHHFVVHQQQVDSVGAPGSTRWCPTHVKVHGVFGMTGLKADGRRKF